MLDYIMQSPIWEDTTLTLLILGLPVLMAAALTVYAILKRGRTALMATAFVWLAGLGIREYGHAYWIPWVTSNNGYQEPDLEAFLSGLHLSTEYTAMTLLPLVLIAVILLGICWWGFYAKSARKTRARSFAYLLTSLLLLREAGAAVYAYNNLDYPVLSLSTEPAWRAGVSTGFNYFFYTDAYVLVLAAVLFIAIKRGFQGRVPGKPFYQQPSLQVKQALTR